MTSPTGPSPLSGKLIRMKRTNLVLDEQLLAEAVKVLGVKTYSASVNVALEEVLRTRKIQSLPELFAQVSWEGDLAEMRGDKAAAGN
jgi:Arc/MetJ family transcription regulator